MNTRFVFCQVAFCFLLTHVCMSCDEGGPSELIPYHLTFLTKADSGAPLENVELFLNKKKIGLSKADGVIRGRVDASIHGSTVNVSWRCPKGYREPQKPLSIQLNVATKESRNRQVQVETSVICIPELRHVSIVVRTNEIADLPVEINGIVAMKTNVAGVATYGTKTKPGSSFDVVLKTDGTKVVGPLNPSRRWVIEDEETLLHFDQVFKVEKMKERSRRRRRRRR